MPALPQKLRTTPADVNPILALAALTLGSLAGAPIRSRAADAQPVPKVVVLSNAQAADPIEFEMTRLLVETGFTNIQFRGAGRLPWLWMTMVMSGDKPAK